MMTEEQREREAAIRQDADVVSNLAQDDNEPEPALDTIEAESDDELDIEQQEQADPRAEFMNELAAKARAQRARDESEGGEEIIQETGREIAQGLEADEQEPETAPVLTEDQDELVNIKVNGQLMRVPRSQVEEAGIRTLQKETSADRKLEALSVREQHLRDREAALSVREQQMRTPPITEQQQADADVDDSQIEEKVRESLTKVYDGDLDAGAEELTKLIAGNRQQRQQTGQQVDVNQVAAQVQQRLDINDARRVFSQEFPELAVNAQLNGMADVEAVRLKQEDPRRSYRDVVREAGQIVRDKIKAMAAPYYEEQTPDNGFQGKREIKSTTEQLRPRSTASARAPKKKEPKPETRSEYIARMRSQRGLPPS
jgi:hypothetical protein